MDGTHLLRRREDLVSRMLSAKTEAETEAAEEAARAWLEDHPGDLAVVVAAERVAGRSESLDDPEVREWRAMRVPFAVCVVPITALVGVFGGWDVAWWVGPFLAFPAASFAVAAFGAVLRLRGNRADSDWPPWSRGS